MSKKNEKALKEICEKYGSFLESCKLEDKGHSQRLDYDDRLLWGVISLVIDMHPHVSTNTILKKLTDLAYEILSQTEVNIKQMVEDKINNLADDLESRIQTYTALVPLQGIDLQINSLEIGKSIIYPHHSGPLNDKLNQLYWSEHLKPLFEEIGCYVITEITGERNYVIEQAYQAASQVVHILNLYLASIRARNSKRLKIEVVGRLSTRDQVVLYDICETENAPNLPDLDAGGVSSSSLELIPYEVSTKTIERWRDWGFDRVVQCFENADPKSIDSRISRAVVWYSKGINSVSPDEQFLAFAIALESLLVGNEGKGLDANWGSINQKLSDRVAFLLGNNFQERLEKRKLAKKLYGIRSEIVHDGESPNLEDVVEMDFLTNHAILSFVKKDFKSWDEFLNWVNQQMYSVTTDTPAKSKNEKTNRKKVTNWKHTWKK